MRTLLLTVLLTILTLTTSAEEITKEKIITPKKKPVNWESPK